MANDKTTAPQVDFSRLPRHVAIILDGNGRWAKKRGLPRTAGHAYGAEAFRRIGNYCKAIGIEYLTVYAFSTENWRRPPEEVRTIMSIFDKYMKKAFDHGARQTQMRFFGEYPPFAGAAALMAAAEKEHTTTAAR
ncbi:MAG: polyprenyl diphosphate synthase [Oscillospiraceae bacterium]